MLEKNLAKGMSDATVGLMAACRDDDRPAEETEVVIVGSGGTGSLLAATLAGAGKRVVILEAGPERKLQDLYSSQIWARRIKWGGPPNESVGEHPISLNFNQGWGTGGAMMHHYGLWLRLHPEDFEVQTRFGRGLDWPIAYEELRPFYDEIQGEVGLSGDAEAEVWRPPGAPYPMPPLPVFEQAKILARGFAAVGLRTAPLPLAINSVEFKGRSPCIYDGWCDAGCPIGALVNPLVIYMPEALAAGAELRHECFATRVLTGQRGERATGVEYYTPDGERHVLHASVVVLAAFAVQNPRILLNSHTDKHPDGLANSSGKVGKFIMANVSGNVFGMFAEETNNFLGVTGGQLVCQDLYAKDPSKGYLCSVQFALGNALKPNDLLGIANSRTELFGNELHAFLQKASHHVATLAVFAEELPNGDNQLILSDKRDPYGFPLARVVHAFGPDAIAGFDAAVGVAKSALTAAGAEEVWNNGRHDAHLFGGTIMGESAGASVTNSYGQTHDVGNLFVTGTGLFPTCGGVNPTFTIYALGLRTAGYMLANWATFT
jgi:choline dehydrogenase-like flavoprotein